MKSPPESSALLTAPAYHECGFMLVWTAFSPSIQMKLSAAAAREGMTPSTARMKATKIRCMHGSLRTWWEMSNSRNALRVHRVPYAAASRCLEHANGIGSSHESCLGSLSRRVLPERGRCHPARNPLRSRRPGGAGHPHRRLRHLRLRHQRHFSG